MQFITIISSENRTVYANSQQVTEPEVGRFMYFDCKNHLQRISCWVIQSYESSLNAISYVYKNVMRRPIHAPVFEGNISQVDNQIKQMQAQVKDCDARIKELGTELTTHLKQDTCRDIALQIAELYNAEHINREKYTNALVKLHQIQVQSVRHSGAHLNAEQQQQITKLMKKLEELSNKGYRTEKFWTDTDIPNDIFISFSR